MPVFIYFFFIFCASFVRHMRECVIGVCTRGVWKAKYIILFDSGRLRRLEATRGLGRAYFSIGRLGHMHGKYLRSAIGLGVDAIGVCKNGSQFVGLRR